MFKHLKELKSSNCSKCFCGFKCQKC